jgi:hypothetical protein
VTERDAWRDVWPGNKLPWHGKLTRLLSSAFPWSSMSDNRRLLKANPDNPEFFLTKKLLEQESVAVQTEKFAANAASELPLRRIFSIPPLYGKW